MNTREVFFNCLKLGDGKFLFKNFQLDEKYWIGIEAVHAHCIFFHKFRKPDMPGHKGIYAFDILNKKIAWQNDDMLFLFAKDDKVYVYQPTFEGRLHFVLDFQNGNVIEELGSDFSNLNKLREESLNSEFTNSFIYPQQYFSNLAPPKVTELMNETLTEPKIAGQINWLEINGLVMFNYHEPNHNGMFSNYFKVYDLAKQRFILKEIINQNSKNLVPESFFVVDNQLFLLVEKSKLVVYKIMQ